jgi:hypothetical protein
MLDHRYRGISLVWDLSLSSYLKQRISGADRNDNRLVAEMTTDGGYLYLAEEGT